MTPVTVNLDEAILPLLVLEFEHALRGLSAERCTHTFRHQYDGVRCAALTITGVGLRLRDNLAVLPDGAELLVEALTSNTAGDSWYEARQRLGEDALLRWRMGPGKTVEELFDACENFDWSPDPSATASPETMQTWRRLLDANLGRFPDVVRVREALVISELVEIEPFFGGFRVLTFDAPCSAPTLTEVLRDGGALRMRARAHFLWLNSD